MNLRPRGESPRLTVLLAGLCAVGLVALFVLPLAFAVDRGRAEDRLFKEAVPLDDAAGSLDSAMLNMETGERGYILTGEASFLQPFQQGQLQYAAAVASARRLTAQMGGERPALLDRTAAAATAWQQNAAAAIAARQQQGAAPDATLQQGKTLFDAYRGAITPLLQRTAADRDALSRDLRNADRRRTLATAGSALLTLLLVGGFGLLLWQRLRLAGRQLASDRYIRTLIDTSCDPMVVLDAGDFRMLDVNRATEAVTGYSRAELLGMSAADLRLPEDRPDLSTTVAQALATGGTATPYPLTWLRKDGSQVPMEFTNGTAKLDGRSVIVATGRDISARLRAEQALRRSEHRLRAYFEHAQDIIVAIEPGGVITYHSPAVGRVLGLEEGSITGSNLLALVHPEDREGALREFAARLAQPGAVHTGILRVRHAGGGWRTLETTAVNLRDDPEIRGLVITGRDISERVQAEAERARLERQNASILAAAGEAIYGLDADGRISFANPAAAALLGWPAAELLGRDAHSTMHHTRMDGTPYPPSACPVHAALHDGSTHHHAGEWYWRRDGSGLPVEYTSTPLREGDAIVGAVVTFNDISERRRAEEAERRRSAYLAALNEAALAVGKEMDPQAALAAIVQRAVAALDSSAGSIVLLEPDGEQLSVAVAVGAARGLKGQFLPRGRGLVGLALEGGRAQAVDDFATWEGRPQSALRNAPVDGVHASVAAPLMAGDRALGAITLSRSVAGKPYTADEIAALEQFAQLATIALENARLHAEARRVNAELEQRVAERTAALADANAQLEGANRELESFTYTASHDLRAPLRTIDGFSRIVLEDYAEVLPADAQRYLNTVRTGAQQMARLIDDLLAFSRVGRQPITRRPVQPRAIVEQVLAELGAAEQGDRLQVCVDELPPAEADSALLKQVYMNLISNAIKYSRPREHAEVTIGADCDGPVPAYFVRDNGVGYDERYANKLFGAFQRLHRQEEFEGTGVGLAIVQRIVHRHGGRIWAQGRLDAGATFWFTLASEAPAG
ncbi:MAG TPA: PAS domain S-box protein [Dehalococcoidia bacterium]|nr:PAS domain S-box protein [Dehalococcoidia bacterium]